MIFTNLFFPQVLEYGFRGGEAAVQSALQEDLDGRGSGGRGAESGGVSLE